MDVDQRSMALSELLLPCLTQPELSTPRLEELTDRMVVGDDFDLASQLHECGPTIKGAVASRRKFAGSLA